MTFRNVFSSQLAGIFLFTGIVLCIPISITAQGKIAFVSDRDGNNEIYVMNADGSNQTRVTNQPSEDIHPSISPDGRKIVFSSNANGDYNIFIVDINGSNRIRLTDSVANDFLPVFSPDGTKIAFSTDRDGISRIYIMNIDGSDQAPISPDTSAASYPSFSPDGFEVLYASNRDGNFEIYRSELSGLNQTRLTNDPGFDSQPVFNSDASKISFRSNRDGNDEIYIMNANGSGVLRLTQDSGSDFEPSFSPDGNIIAFTSDRGGTFDIYTMGVDGSNQAPLTSNGGSNSDPSWVNPVLAPPSLENLSITPTIDEGDNATLSGNIFSADLSQTLSLSVNWGDGSPVQNFNYPAGTTSFSQQHTYMDDPPTGPNDDTYQISATLTTFHGASTASTFVKVSNTDPVLNASSDAPTILGSQTSINGSINDAGTLDSHDVSINWGDGSPVTTLIGGAGAHNFSASHLYSSLGGYTITVAATDKDGGSAQPASMFIGIVPPPTSGKIAFTSNYGGNNNIWLMNSNGTGQIALTTNPASDAYPNLSKDGSQILFSSDRDGNQEIYSMNAVGSFQTRLTNNAGTDTTPVFSPDGTKIVFASNRDGNYEIYIMNANGTGQTRLTNNALDDGQATFSPDGTKIYFVRLASNQSDSHIWSMDLSGANQAALTTGSFVLNGQPNFSPDGQKIVFSSVRPFSGISEPEIFIMDANGANQTRLTTAAGQDLEPVFSPDGTKIAFRSERDGNAEIYLMDANGANQQRITFDGAGVSNFAPSWASTPQVNVDISDTLAAEQGAFLTVPIIVTDTTGTGIISYDFALNFDPAVLQPLATPVDKTGTLSSGFEVNSQNMTGKVVVSGFGTVPLTGAGTLLNIKFNVIGTPPTTTALTLAPFTFNEGIPFSDVSGGFAFVQGTISGTVTYGTSQAVIGVPGVALNGFGSPNVSTVTASNGDYQLHGFGSGAYTVIPSKTGDVNGITALDASTVSKFLVGAMVLSANQQTAAEVSGNGTITSFDAALIAQYVVGLPNTGLTGSWLFIPSSRSYMSVGTLVNEDYTAILIGEVSGNWMPGASPLFDSISPLRSSGGLNALSMEARARPSSLTLSLPTLKPGGNTTVVVPVTLKFAGTSSIEAYQFDINYDPRVLQPDTTAVDVVGTLSAGLAAISNSNGNSGRLRIAVYGSSSIASSGTLLNLRFRIVGSKGSSSTLGFAGLLINEGNPAASGNSGKITVTK